jgi:chromosome partitioning protein
MVVVAVANQKGGVGKTTCCINLAAELGRAGKKVLLVDMDPQGNSTSGLGVDRTALGASTYDVLVGDGGIGESLHVTDWQGISVLPATLDLAGAEVELAGAMSRETRLSRKLADLKGFDLVLVDCPPSLGLLTLNAFVAATKLLVPIQCEYFALEGVGQLLQTVDLVRDYLNESLTLSGVVLTMFDPRTRLSREVATEVRNQFGQVVFETVIPRNVRLSEAPSFGKPIGYYDAQCAGAEAYRSLSEEVALRWLNKER